MAENKSIIKLRGKLGELVFVQSHFGNHVRHKRGTYKAVTINDTLKANAGRAVILNQIASPFYAALCNIAGRYRDGGAWSRILSRFRLSASNDPAALFSQLKMMQMNKQYPVSEVWSIPIGNVTISATKLMVYMHTVAAPHFKSDKSNNVFRYHLTALFKQDNSYEWTHDGTHTDWMPLSNDYDSWNFSFNRPAGSGIYVLVLRLEAGYHDRPVGTLELTRVLIHSAGAY